MTLTDARLKQIEHNLDRCLHLFGGPKNERNPNFGEDFLIVSLLPRCQSLAWCREAIEDNRRVGNIDGEQRMFLLKLFGFISSEEADESR